MKLLTLVWCVPKEKAKPSKSCRNQEGLGIAELHADRKWHRHEFIYHLLHHTGRNVSSLGVGNIT